MESDRVSYSFGMKINIGNYENVDIHASLSTDVKEGETEVMAMKRASEFVEDLIDAKHEELKGASVS